MSTEIKQVSVFLTTSIKQKEPLIAACTGVCLQGSLSLNRATWYTLTLLSLSPGKVIVRRSFCVEAVSTFMCIILRNGNNKVFISLVGNFVGFLRVVPQVSNKKWCVSLV